MAGSESPAGSGSGELWPLSPRPPPVPGEGLCHEKIRAGSRGCSLPPLSSRCPTCPHGVPGWGWKPPLDSAPANLGTLRPFSPLLGGELFPWGFPAGCRGSSGGRAASRAPRHPPPLCSPPGSVPGPGQPRPPPHPALPPPGTGLCSRSKNKPEETKQGTRPPRPPLQPAPGTRS